MYAFLLMVLFQYGVALHELETERIRSGEISLSDKKETSEGIWRKTKQPDAQGLRGVPAAGRTRSRRGCSPAI